MSVVGCEKGGLIRMWKESREICWIMADLLAGGVALYLQLPGFLIYPPLYPHKYFEWKRAESVCMASHGACIGLVIQGHSTFGARHISMQHMLHLPTVSGRFATSAFEHTYIYAHTHHAPAHMDSFAFQAADALHQHVAVLVTSSAWMLDGLACKEIWCGHVPGN